MLCFVRCIGPAMKIRELIALVKTYWINKDSLRTDKWPRSKWCHLIYTCRPRGVIVESKRASLCDVLYRKTEPYCDLNPSNKLAYIVCKLYLRHWVWLTGDDVTTHTYARSQEWLDENVDPKHYFQDICHANIIGGENMSHALFAFRKREDAIRFKLII